MNLRKCLIGVSLSMGLIIAVAIASGEASTAESHPARRTTAASPTPTRLASGIEQANFDKSVRFQDDLFRAVNGAWLAKTEIPPDRSDYGVFAILAEKAERDCREIIENCAAAKDNIPGSERQKVGDLYVSFMDEGRAEELGIRPIAAKLAEVDAIHTKADLLQTLAELLKIGISGPLACYIGPDAKKSDEHILEISQAGLGLPDRDYYWDVKFKAKLNAYQAYVERVLTLAGIGGGKQAAAEIVALETQMAKRSGRRWQTETSTKPTTRWALRR